MDESSNTLESSMAVRALEKNKACIHMIGVMFERQLNKLLSSGILPSAADNPPVLADAVVEFCDESLGSRYPTVTNGRFVFANDTDTTVVVLAFPELRKFIV
jgi:hypothetical protein